MGSKRKLVYVTDWPFDADGRALPFEGAEIARLVNALPPARALKLARHESLPVPVPRVPERPVAMI